MREEVQLTNLSIIYFKNITGSKSDFALLCNYPKKSKEFRDWFNSLVKEGVLKEEGIGARNNIVLYKISKTKALGFIEKFSKFRYFERLFFDKYEGVFRH